MSKPEDRPVGDVSSQVKELFCRIVASLYSEALIWEPQSTTLRRGWAAAQCKQIRPAPAPKHAMRSLPSLYSSASISKASAPFQSSAAQARRKPAPVKWTAVRVFLSNNQWMVTVSWVTIYPDSPAHSVCSRGLTPPPITPSLFLSLPLSSSLQSKQCKPQSVIWYSGHGNQSTLGGLVLSLNCRL